MAPSELKEALAKKGGLSLAQLASYDDLITDALVDRVSRACFVEGKREIEKVYANTGCTDRSTIGPEYARIDQDTLPRAASVRRISQASCAAASSSTKIRLRPLPNC